MTGRVSGVLRPKLHLLHIFCCHRNSLASTWPNREKGRARLFGYFSSRSRKLPSAACALLAFKDARMLWLTVIQEAWYSSATMRRRLASPSRSCRGRGGMDERCRQASRPHVAGSWHVAASCLPRTKSRRLHLNEGTADALRYA